MHTNNSPGEMACYPPPSAAGNEFTAPAADPASLTITRPLLEEALAAKPALAALSSEEKKAVLLSMADALEAEQEKILAAKRAGITELILSEENRKDIAEIKPEYIAGLTFHYVKTNEEVLQLALE
mgnify:CR=1 FL=1